MESEGEMSEPMTDERLAEIEAEANYASIKWRRDNDVLTLSDELIVEVHRLRALLKRSIASNSFLMDELADMELLELKLETANAVCEEVSEAQDPVKRPRNFERMFSKLDAWRLT